MAAVVVADSDVLIDYLTKSEPGFSRVRQQISLGLQTTVVSRHEILVGARTARQLDAANRLLSRLVALPVDATAADLAAEIRRGLAARGLGIGMADSLIAASTIAAGSSLLTRNRRHFELIPGLRLEDIGANS